MLTGNGGGGNGDPRARGTRAAREPEPAPEKLEIGFATRLRFLSMAELEAARAARYGLSLSLALFVLEDRAALRAALDQDLERCDWEIGNRLAGGIRQGPDVLARFALGEWRCCCRTPAWTAPWRSRSVPRARERPGPADLRSTGATVGIGRGRRAPAGPALWRGDRRQPAAGGERAQRQSSALGGGRAVGLACDPVATPPG